MSSSRGFLVIITIDGAEEEKLRQRKDELNLKSTFELMGAEVEILRNSLKSELIDVMKKYKKEDFSHYSYVAFAYLSHGSEDGHVVTKNNEIMEIQKTILTPLCRNPTLDGKLKWLIMQSCRGSYDFLQDQAEGPGETRIYPKYYAKFFATSEGMQADIYDNGSLFINALCQRLRSEYESNDIISIMSNASADVRAVCVRNKFDYIQKPCVEENLGRNIFKITSGFSNRI